LVYFPKQTNVIGLDLTVKKIYSLQSQGALDFGGSEFLQANKTLIDPKIENDPKYGWWTLNKAEYIVEFNEILIHKEYFAIVFPHDRLQMTGCYHSPFIVNPATSEEHIPLSTLLIVFSEGVRIKENARISTALTYRI
jgi:hypothetical protein